MIWQTRLVFALMKQAFRSAPKGFSKFPPFWSFSGLEDKNDSLFPNFSLLHQQVPLSPENSFSSGSLISFPLDFSFTYSFDHSFDPLAVYPGSVATIFAAQGQSDTTTETTKLSPTSRISNKNYGEEITECKIIFRPPSDLPLAVSFAATSDVSLSNVSSCFDSGKSFMANNLSEKVMETPESWRKISIPYKASETGANSDWQIQKKRHENKKKSPSKYFKSSNMASANGSTLKNPFSVLMGLEADLDVEPQESEAAPAEIEETEKEVPKAGHSSKQFCLSENLLNQILMRVLAKSSIFIFLENASRNIFSEQPTKKNIAETKMDLIQDLSSETLTRHYMEHLNKLRKKEPWRFSTYPYKFRISSSGSNSPFKVKMFSRPPNPALNEELKAYSIKEFVADPTQTCVG